MDRGLVMERGLEIERDGDREIERWRKRSREMGESSASMGEELHNLRPWDFTASNAGLDVKRRYQRQSNEQDF